MDFMASKGATVVQHASKLYMLCSGDLAVVVWLVSDEAHEQLGTCTLPLVIPSLHHLQRY